MERDSRVSPDAVPGAVVLRRLDAGALKDLLHAVSSGSLFTLREAFDVAKGSGL